MTKKSQLRDAVLRFREWAHEHFPNARSGEWELEYEHWDELYRAATDVLETEPKGWDEETKELLIYAVARDNEVGILVSRLGDIQVSTLSAFASQSKESDAKWQLVVQLGKMPLTDERKSLLLSFASDPAEYVRRRSLMVLADCGSHRAESLAFDAWESGNEYQRMASLHALKRVGSPMLPHYLTLAEKDGRQRLQRIAEQIKNCQGEYQD